MLKKISQEIKFELKKCEKLYFLLEKSIIFLKKIKIKLIDKIWIRMPHSIKLQKEIKKKYKIGMAVLAHERPEYLKKCLDSLFKTKLYNYDITFLIQDDGSKNPEVKKIIEEKRNKKYKIIRCFTSKGHNSWGAAFNKAIKKLLTIDNFDIIGSCDSDAIFHPEWLNKTMQISLWAKKYHKKNILGPFSSFNSSDQKFHEPIGTHRTPYGDFVVKTRMGALNYFYFKKDFLQLGYFKESRDDETLMTKKFKKLRVRNFCTKISYIEHIGKKSILDQWRPVPVGKNIVYAINNFYSEPIQNYKNNNEFIKKILTLLFLKNSKNPFIDKILIRLKMLKIKKQFNVEVSITNKFSSFTPSKLPIDVIIPATEKDFIILPHTIKSIKTHIKHPIKNIFIIAPDSKKIKKICEDNEVKFIDENRVLPITKKNINYKINGVDRSGWLFQQLLKLNGDKISTQENFLITDADTIFIRPQTFEYKNKIILDLSSEFHKPYFEAYTNITGLKHTFSMSFVAHHMLIQKKYLIDLKKLIEKKHNKSWLFAIIENTNTNNASGFSEYETYGNYILTNYPHTIILEYFSNIMLSSEQTIKIISLKRIYATKYKTASFHNYL